MYFQLTVDIFSDFGIDEPKGLPLELDFINGSVITMPIDLPMVFTTNATAEDKPPDFWDSEIPVISKRFVELLEGAGVDNFQKFPALIKSEEDGTVWDNYYAVNILGMIRCVDFEKSEYTELFPDNFDFDVLAIDAEKPKGALLFRLQESPSTIIIHKSIGKHIMLNDPDETLTGWDVKEIIQ